VLDSEANPRDVSELAPSSRPRRSRSRRSTSDEKTPSSSSRTRKATKTTRTSSATKAPARSRKAASEGATDDGGGTSDRRPNRRAPRRATKSADAPATSAASEDLEALTLLQRQATLIEQQTELLKSLVDAQRRTAVAIESSVSSGGNMSRDGSGEALEVKPRLAIFVDVPNILYAAERAGVTVDWTKVANFFSRGRTLMRAIAYAPISDDPGANRDAERFVLPFLDKDYRIVTKPLKRFSGGAVKANFDVELAIDILTMADRLDVIGLVSGDGDFRRLVEIVGSRGVRVEVMAFGASTSKDIREVADRYIDIAAYVPELCQ
jgi:uncharacterized LabA/DUF88 family protein